MLCDGCQETFSTYEGDKASGEAIKEVAEAETSGETVPI